MNDNPFGGIILVIAVIIVVFGAIFAVIGYWSLRGLESEMMGVANVTGNATAYYGYVETINYWPHAAWMVLLFALGFGGYLVVKRH